MVATPPFALARRWCAAAVVTGATALGGCSGDDSVVAPDDTGAPVVETLAIAPFDATIPGETLGGESEEFLDGVLADDTVTADELEAAYAGYLDCLAAGGGSGSYAYDIELRASLTVEWSTDPDEAGAIDADVLAASCSRQYLGDLIRRFERADPPATDLAERQQQSIEACVSAISPAAAASLPDAITLDTTGDAVTVNELQLDLTGLDDDPDNDLPIRRCLASIGSGWHEFG